MKKYIPVFCCFLAIAAVLTIPVLSSVKKSADSPRVKTESDTVPSSPEPEKPTETENGELEEESAETEISAQAIARPTIYIVKKGDNLRAISRKFYGSISMVDEICRINEIENPNHIQPGQNILLP